MARLFNRTTQQGSRTSLPMATTLPMTLFMALQSRKTRYRSTLVVLAVLLCLSTYLLARSSSSASHTLLHKDMPSDDQMPVVFEEASHSHVSGTARKHRKVHKDREQVTLDPSQELAAISSFLASLPQNVIPLSVDPSVTVDPQLVLDFDTRSPRAAAEVQHMVADVWLRNPVFLYSKLYSPASREVKAMLAKMDLRPAPTIIDVDIRDDAEVLEPIIKRLSSSSDLPVLLIGGKPVGSMKEIRLLDKSGELRKLVAASGAVVDGSKKKQHKH
ncbi:putative expressed protein [Lyophyllum shimeji]|uniref:Expressed protein n=1 Tax=Lyophyllum shimeji TaxID=47721 RepID=A0A9P3UN33_LYOSH|nr:putative expressed protein [Lyophyllum shimeji]